MKVGAKTQLSEGGHMSTEGIDNLQLNSPSTSGKKDSVYEEIPKTPFILIKRDGLYYIVWLSYVLSNAVKTKKEALAKLRDERFELTAMYILAILQEQKAEAIKKMKDLEVSES